jgi:hypothetical protein
VSSGLVLQVYEETAGLCVGDVVNRTKKVGWARLLFVCKLAHLQVLITVTLSVLLTAPVRGAGPWYPEQHL